MLQHTRCPYYRDTGYACNKREPGSGCAALAGGRTHLHAILGGFKQCVAMYPGDWAQALIAFDAVVTVVSTTGVRRIPFAALHRLPGDTPETETTLKRDEIITMIEVPVVPSMKGSHYLKARDRESHAFASVSAAIGMALDGDRFSDARIALGGVAAKPWRASAAEAVLRPDVQRSEAKRGAPHRQCHVFAALERHKAARTLVSVGADTQVGAMDVAVTVAVFVAAGAVDAHALAVVVPVLHRHGAAHRIGLQTQLDCQPIGRHHGVGVGECQPARPGVKRSGSIHRPRLTHVSTVGGNGDRVGRLRDTHGVVGTTVRHHQHPLALEFGRPCCGQYQSQARTHQLCLVVRWNYHGNHGATLPVRRIARWETGALVRRFG